MDRPNVPEFFTISSCSSIFFTRIFVVLVAVGVSDKVEARRVPKSKVKSLWLHKGPVRVWQKPRYSSPIRGEIEKCGRFPTMKVLNPGDLLSSVPLKTP